MQQRQVLCVCVPTSIDHVDWTVDVCVVTTRHQLTSIIYQPNDASQSDFNQLAAVDPMLLRRLRRCSVIRSGAI